MKRRRLPDPPAAALGEYRSYVTALMGVVASLRASGHYGAARSLINDIRWATYKYTHRRPLD